MKKKIAILFILGVSILSSCQGQDNNESLRNNSSTDINIDSTNETDIIETKLSSGVVVKAEVKIPKSVVLESMPIYTASLQEVPFEKFDDLFMENDKIINKIEQPSEDNSGDGIYKYYQAKDGSTLTYNGGVFLHYSSAQYNDIQVDFEIEGKEQERFNKDFKFETRQSADKTIRKIFNNLGLDIFEQYDCYSIDYEWLQERNSVEGNHDIADKMDTNKKEILWNDSLNCYLFQYFGSINGVPITDLFREEQGILIPAPKIYVIYSKNGIEQIEISNCFQIEEEESKASVYDVKEVLAVLDNKYNSIILEGNYCVEKMQLEYAPIETDKINNYKLIPTWRVFITHELNVQSKENPDEWETVRIPVQVLFSAIDGKELQTGVGM